MENFRALLGDVLEKTTGVRTTPEASEESNFQIACNELILSLERQSPEMMDQVMQACDILADTTVVDFTEVSPLLEKTIRDFTARSTTHLPPVQVDTINRFLPIGAETICFIAHLLGRGRDPETFESNRDLVVLAASLMSEYPGPISANVKVHMAMNAGICMKNGDLTPDFRAKCSRMLMGMISQHPESRERVERLRSCPARKYVDKFAGIIFDLYAACHRSVWERLKDDQNSDHAITQQGIGNFEPSVMTKSLS